MNSPLTAALGGLALLIGLFRCLFSVATKAKLLSNIGKEGTLIIFKRILNYALIALILFLLLIFGLNLSGSKGALTVNNNEFHNNTYNNQGNSFKDSSSAPKAKESIPLEDNSASMPDNSLPTPIATPKIESQSPILPPAPNLKPSLPQSLKIRSEASRKLKQQVDDLVKMQISDLREIYALTDPGGTTKCLQKYYDLKPIYLKALRRIDETISDARSGASSYGIGFDSLTKSLFYDDFQNSITDLNTCQQAFKVAFGQDLSNQINEMNDVINEI